VFRQFHFITSVDQALAQGDFSTGDIPAITLDLPPSSSDEAATASGWSESELKKLALLALRADRQALERQAITVTGAPAQIEQALAAAFLAVPTSQRPTCMFDTYFYRCNLVATYFWAIGLPEPPVSIKFTHVDGAARQVRGDLASQPDTAYERWAMQVIETSRLADLPRQRNYAFALGEWLDGRTYDLSLLNAAPNELIAAMFKVSPSSVQLQLRSQVRKKLPSALVDRAAQRVYQQSSELTLYRQLRQGFELSQLLESLYESYAEQEFVQPPRAEIKALEEILAQTHHSLLNLFVIYWANRKHLPRALAQVAESDYRHFGQITLEQGLLKPEELFVPGRSDIFLDLYLSQQKVDDVAEVVEALLKAGEAAGLTRLTGAVAGLPAKKIKELAQLIDDQANIPTQFRQAVEQAIAAVPAGGLKAFWHTIWSRPSDDDLIQ
jgi:hypothetical protein